MKLERIPIGRILASDPIAVAMWQRNRGIGFTARFEREVERVLAAGAEGR